MQAITGIYTALSNIESVKKILNKIIEYIKNSGKLKKSIWLILAIYILWQIAKSRGWLPKKSVNQDVVMITGGGQGIGRRLALGLAAKGAKIAVLDINQETANKVSLEIQNQGGKAIAIKCDVCDISQISEAKNQIKQQLGQVTMLINNAGIVTGKYFEDLNNNNIELSMKVNATSHFNTIKEVIQGMIEQKRGHIITISSAAGIIGTPRLTDYCASKFACFGLHEALYLELMRKQETKHIRMTIICPYFINTGMFEGVKTRFSFLLPILKEEWAAKRIINAILQEEEMVVLPWFSNFTYLMRFLLPPFVSYKIYDYLGAYKFMENFKGHGISE